MMSNLVLLVFSLLFNVSRSHKLSIDTLQLANTVDDDFLSVTLDSGQIIKRFNEISAPLLSDKVLTLCRALGPTYLRIGGTEGDQLTFTNLNSNVTTGVMNSSQFDLVYKFVSQSGWNMIFGLNQLLTFTRHDSTKVWDSSNAEMLIRYCMERGYKVAWELGNEPDLYMKHGWPSISGSQGAANFRTLRNLLNDLDYPITLMAGPDVAVLHGMNYLSDYLSVIGDTINATTWHHYYRSAEGAVLTDFYDIKTLDKLISDIYQLRDIVSNTSFRGDLWIGETSSTYGGGDPVLSSSFVSGFMWLDKLGLSAYDHKKIFRQEIINAKYSLLSSTGDPYPDYWLSLLYKKLVGTRVLRVADAFEYNRIIRIYAHCAKQPYPAGSVVLLILNTDSININVTLTDDELYKSPMDMYWLTPYQSANLTTRDVALNGVHLVLGEDNALPQLVPKQMDAGSDLELQGLSFGYVVFKNSQVKACM